MSGNQHRLCQCGCEKRVARCTENRHLSGKAPTHILTLQILAENSQQAGQQEITNTPPTVQRQTTASISGYVQPCSSGTHNTDVQSTAPNPSHNFPGDGAGLTDTPEVLTYHDGNIFEDNLEPRLHQHRRTTVKDVEDEEDNDEFQPLGINAIDNDDWMGNELGSDDKGEVGESGEDSRFQYYAPIDEMVESFEREMAEIGAFLSLSVTSLSTEQVTE
jgi:hypothetical protein